MCLILVVCHVIRPACVAQVYYIMSGPVFTLFSGILRASARLAYAGFYQ